MKKPKYLIVFSPFFRKSVMYYVIIFFLLSSCNQSLPQIGESQRAKIQIFFEEFLLEHGGAYTLFGSKPVTIENLLDPSEADQAFLENHPEVDFVLINRGLEEGWEEWKKYSKDLNQKRYILSEIKVKDCRFVVLINIKHTLQVIKEHYEKFRQVIGKDFNPHKSIAQAKDDKELFWEKVFLNHITMGLLLGYGEKNSELFERRVRGRSECKSASSSENNDPRKPAECYLNQRPFRIPLFVMLDPEESHILVGKYKKERCQIKSTFEGKDFLDVTLQKF